MKTHGRCLLPITIAIFSFFALTSLRVKATPYAGEVTNNNGTIQFYVNEGGGNITVTYNDGTTNANFNGITTGTNEPSGLYSFSLGSHTTYAISIAKVGTGFPSVIQTVGESGATVNPRGVAVNNNIGSPYLGRVYWADGAGTPSSGVFLMNPDLSFVGGSNAPLAAGVTFSNALTTTGTSPYRLSVAWDDSVIVGCASQDGCGVYRMDPNFITNQLLLGPIGVPTGKKVSTGSHGTIESDPIITGSLSTSNLVLYEVDGELFSQGNPNCIQVYEWTNSVAPNTNKPTYAGYEVGVNIDSVGLGGNEFCGLHFGPSGYLYASTYRNNLSNPSLQIYDSTGRTNLWNSWLPAGTSYPPSGASPTGDIFYNANDGQALIDSTVTPDGQYLFGVDAVNTIAICPLTNGIPNVAELEWVSDPLGPPTSIFARGVACDIADNLYESSSYFGTIQEWTLGQSTTAITTGSSSTNVATGFTIAYPPNGGSVTASNSMISQPNTHGNPTSTFFVITMNPPPTNSVTVGYTLSGTAFGGTYNGVSYPISFSANPPGSVTFAPGQTSAVVQVTSISDSIPRPTTTLTIALTPSLQYQPLFPTTASLNILNTGPQELFTAVGSPSMYKAFSNDYGSFAITRWGDTNLTAYTVNSFSIIGGTGVKGTDYTAPSPVTFNPGDLTDYSYIYPLAIGQLPVDTNIVTYTGNKTIIAKLTSTSGYTAVPNTNDFTILDNGNPPAPVLFFDPLTNSAPTNYNITATDENYPVTAPDYFASFGYDLTADSQDPANVPVPFPPNGQNYALRVTCNKNSQDQATNTYSTAVNLYPTNVTFSGNFAVRFNMNVTKPYNFATLGSYEGPLFGINFSGTETNWWANGSGSAPGNSALAETNWVYDGLWVWMTDDGESEYASYNLFSWSGTNYNMPKTIAPLAEANASSFTNNFKSAIFTSVLPVAPFSPVPGIPCNGSPDNNQTFTSWADVELKQFNNVITLSIDKTHILVYTNTTPFTNGVIMLGYNTPVFGTDGQDGAAYYSNLRVVQLAPPTVTQLAYDQGAGTFTFDFTSPDGTVNLSQFIVVGSTNVIGTYTAVPGATVTELNGGTYQATVPVSGPIEFYQVQEEYQ